MLSFETVLYASERAQLHQLLGFQTKRHETHTQIKREYDDGFLFVLFLSSRVVEIYKVGSMTILRPPQLVNSNQLNRGNLMLQEKCIRFT